MSAVPHTALLFVTLMWGYWTGVHSARVGNKELTAAGVFVTIAAVFCLSIPKKTYLCRKEVKVKMMNSYNDKVAVVTGGAQGIGRCIAKVIERK